eukprot:CAMPEP_0171171934 /NCGR_PEP_ID=MMETSP0790-20130122/9466_1 /TAXON_ID=2925 /ORGANISM="Alexandrium catenella, Strain OF101" /LENGTH=183 /DNA_ID=CAMNT_0011636789 /DNA_START=146 /DNA_END=697 /DNA_ORIENTATION=+
MEGFGMSSPAHGAVPGLLVGPTATVLAVSALAVGIYASLSVALAHRHCGAKAPKQPRQRCRKARAAPSKETADLEMGLISPEKKRRRPRGKRTKMQKLMQIFIGMDSSDAGSDCGEGPFDLDDESWLAPTDAAAGGRAAEQHFIGDSSSAPANGGEVATPHDAFGLADELWHAPQVLAAKVFE